MSGTLPTYSKTRRSKKTNFSSQFTRNFPETGPIFVIFTSLYIQQDETSGLKFGTYYCQGNYSRNKTFPSFSTNCSWKICSQTPFQVYKKSGVFVKVNHTDEQGHPCGVYTRQVNPGTANFFLTSRFTRNFYQVQTEEGVHYKALLWITRKTVEK